MKSNGQGTLFLLSNHPILTYECIDEPNLMQQFRSGNIALFEADETKPPTNTGYGAGYQ